MMTRLSLTPVHGAINGEVEIPGSKYLANRLITLAALAKGSSTFHGVPDNDDINTAVSQWETLGMRVEGKVGNQNEPLVLLGVDGKLSHPPTGKIFSGASGTFSRFISAVLALSAEPILLSGDAKMNTRPMADLFVTLRSLAAKVDSDNDRLPAQIQGPLRGGKATISGSVSSQYISALLLVGPYMQADFHLQVEGEVVSKKYIDMTVDLMRRFGADVKTVDDGFMVSTQQVYQGQQVAIEADPVSSSYFMAIAALTGGTISIKRFNHDSLQGEAKFPELLERMGCKVQRENELLTITGPSDGLIGIDADLKTMPDIGQTLAILAACASGKTHLRNISHLKYKESDRIADTAKELRKLGIDVSYDDNNMIVQGGEITGGEIQTYDDHRMAMSFALLGLKTKNLVINDAQVVSKSFPTYWQTLESLGIQVSEV